MLWKDKGKPRTRAVQMDNIRVIRRGDRVPNARIRE